MNYITTTQLRTKSSELVETLKKGGSVSLIHRSKVVAEIRPKNEPKPLTKFDIKKLQKLAEKLNLPKTSYKEREKRYRNHLTEKYGKGLS
ncbi:hypothetical protein HY407_00325 [Candidatus Gottesmanbacteria bacterium]|nr:hypothetical protein [Candidatus Gottesmanbacteria bacterium]